MTTRKQIVVRVALISGCLLAAAQARADFITDRATLNTLLGSDAINETFERFIVADGNALNLNTNTLNSNTVALGQGPGLVVGGVTFSVNSPSLQWNGNDWFGLFTKSISGNGGSTLSIDFTQQTTAFGIDLETYRGFPMTVTATIFATDDVTVLATMSNIAVNSPSPVFLGFEDNGGIGRVALTTTGQPFTVVIDNLTFGAGAGVIPEPSTLTLLAVGTLSLLGYGWRRQVRRGTKGDAGE